MLRVLLASLAIFSFSVFANPKVLVETNLGPFTIELNQEQAPASVENFLKYVEDGSYVGSIFHRVIPGFMAQGGGFDQKMGRLATNPPIRNEASNGLENKTATIAMARTNAPDSATRQFFINYKDNQFLNMSAGNAGYAVFGEVTQGFDVVQSMATKPTKTMGRMQDVPVEPIVIINVTLLK
ncbi:peptidylprolyl isomerase [Vibrio sp. ZSDE26]|uniref:Peptidyl-prolyl cis-trans isomerase n=1 Tax=Vibrio amylolyticus TaxID=2847292 RepID=A0A9X2BG56_9VIBR|nr:peptidylprolyl isomerase [Vibrio amylolyticus]MCK6262551.1 peptidylprolyl isomerase [Vibrio amylolyticus]